MAFMPGFDEQWRDAPDFIHGMTRAIWEDHHFDHLNGYFEPETILRQASGVSRSQDNVARHVRAVAVEQPDLVARVEDVIWVPVGFKGFLASQRLFCTATHAGGAYAPATHKQLTYRVLRDQWCRGNAVAETWEVTDQGAILRQLGLNPEDWARDLIRREGGPAQCVKPLTPANDPISPYEDSGNDNQWGHMLAGLLTRIMRGELGVIPGQYDPAAELAYPGHVTGSGHSAASKFWMPLCAAFPNAQFSVAHVIGLEDPLNPPRASVRWSLIGKHDGWGSFGAPSGAMVHVMGITHAEFGPNGLRREWTLIDETAVWKQIILARGAV